MSLDPDRGSATVEFALVSVLTCVLFAAVLQVALAVHVRNTLIAAAAEGARYGAAADRTPADAAQRATEIITASLSGAYARDVTADYQRVAGVLTVVVEVAAPMPVLGLVGPNDALDVQAHAMAEQLP